MFEKMNSFLEKWLMPIGYWLSNNWFLNILRKGMMAAMPLTIAGSIALIIQYFPFIDTVLPPEVMGEVTKFLGVVGSASLDLVSLFVAGGIGYYYCKEKGNEALFGTVVAICAFLILTPMQLVVEGVSEPITGVIPTQWLGAKGLFVAMIVGFLSGAIYNRLVKSKLTIKLPASVPPAIAEPFKVLFPVFFTLVVFAAIRYGFAFTSYGDIHTLIFTILQQPLMSLGTTLPASIIIVIFVQLMWLVGLHGQQLAGSVMGPIWQSAMIMNLANVQAGKAPEFIFTEQFFAGFIYVQFISLVIAILISAKSAQLKAVGRLSIGSSVFGISEPLVFGTPVVLNAVLLIPWILVMVVFVLITWAAMEFGLCPLPLGTNIPWTTPPLLSGWLITGSIMGAVVQFVCFAVGVVIYLPFVRLYDKQVANQEENERIKNEEALKGAQNEV